MGIRAHPRLTSGKTSKGHFGTQSLGCAGQTVRPSFHSISQTSAGKLLILKLVGLCFPSLISDGDDSRLIGATARENRPGDAGELVGECDRQHVTVQPPRCLLDPRPQTPHRCIRPPRQHDVCGLHAGEPVGLLHPFQIDEVVQRGQRHTSLRSCQFSYPLSFRGQVCEAQGPLPCFPPTVLSTWHPSFLDRVQVSPVPRCHRSYWGATTSRYASPVTYLLRFRGPRAPPCFVSRSLRSR